jgi:hypothetical protein
VPSPNISRHSALALLSAVAALLIGLFVAVEAVAHHPGSHARRVGAGQVELDAAVSASDACTRIERMEPGTPQGVQAPTGAAPVVVRLVRPDGLCATVVSALREARTLSVPAGTTALLLYVVGPDGRVAASERVPIR